MQNEIQFAGHLDDDKAIEAKFDGIQGKIDELLVLVTVADNAGLGVLDHGYGDNKFSLAPGLKAVMVAGAEAGNFFNHLLLLVYFDGIHPAVLAPVIELFDRVIEALVQNGKLGVQHILDPQENRHVQTPLFNPRNDLHKADSLMFLPPYRCGDNFPLVGNSEEPLSPVGDAV